MHRGSSCKSRKRPKDWSNPAKLYPLDLAITENRFCERDCVTVVAATRTGDARFQSVEVCPNEST
jgi:hypothetical protein